MSSDSVPVTQHIQLDELVDPFEARLNVYRDDNGAISQVSFDLSGLPRIDGMLIGKPALAVPDITKRLCGLCPVVHHLAGMRAVEDLFGISDIPRTAQLIRELLAAGSTLDNLATKFVAVDRDGAQAMKRAGKAIMRAAGSPSHFPDVAVPGGVRAAVDRLLVIEAREVLKALSHTAVIQDAELADAAGVAAPWKDTFEGLDIAVVDSDGELAPLGNFLAVTTHDSESAVQVFPASQWPLRVRETRPGDAAPRPVFDNSTGPNADDWSGARPDFYRVGPLSRQVVVGKHGMCPRNAQHQLLIDTVAWAEQLLADEELLGTQVCAPEAQAAIEHASFEGQRSGVGIIDGPRGLLVHRYTAGADGIITDCQIMTPTAQNELWLTRMLTEQLCDDGQTAVGSQAAKEGAEPETATKTGNSNGASGVNNSSGIEESIWAADPCLPCSSAPAGVMTFQMQERACETVDDVPDVRDAAKSPTTLEREK